MGRKILNDDILAKEEDQKYAEMVFQNIARLFIDLNK